MLLLLLFNIDFELLAVLDNIELEAFKAEEVPEGSNELSNLVIDYSSL